MSRVLKIGFIGGGVNSAIGATHRISATMDNRWKITSGCFSRHKEINTETGNLCNVPEDRTYNSVDEFLGKEAGGLDAVAVLTPTPTHYEIVSKALEKGFNVICEKSLTLSSHEAENLKKAQKDNKSFLSVTHNYTGYPMLRELRRLIENADLGKINQIKIEMPLETYLNQESEKSQPVPQEWRLKDYNVSSISLDLASHIYNLINFLSGEKAEELIAVENTFGRFNQVVDDVNCICKFTNNLLCNIWFSKSAIGHRNGLRIRVYGSKASAEWYQMEPEYLKLSMINGEVKTIDRTLISRDKYPIYDRFKAGHPSGFIEAFANHYYDIADSLMEFQESSTQSNEYIFGVDHAIETLKFLEAVKKSAESQSWQKVG